MAAEPDPGVGTIRRQFEPLLAGMGDQRRHEAVGGAGSAQFFIGLDMHQGLGAVPHPVAGMDQPAIFFLFETLAFSVVDDHFLDVSRCIQGSARPIGTIHSVPARA